MRVRRYVDHDMFESLTLAARQACDRAGAEASGCGSPTIGPAHLLLGVLQVARVRDDVPVRDVLEELEVDADRLRPALLGAGEPATAPPPAGVSFERSAQAVLQGAWARADADGRGDVDLHDLLGELLRPEHGLREQLPCAAELQLKLDRLHARGAGDDPAVARTALDRFCWDMTAGARAGDLDPVIGREDELRRVEEVLCRRDKNAPVLLGEAGVGKTAVAEALAQRLAAGHAPAAIAGRRLLALRVGALVGGTRLRGEFEERMTQIIDEATGAGDVILFVDEMHALVGAGRAEGSLDAATLLKEPLARGQVMVLGASTQREFARSVERDPALVRRFHPVAVNAPSPAEALQIVTARASLYETHHQVNVTADACAAAVELTERYLTDRQLPDKALDALDGACAAVARRADRDQVDRAEVAAVVADWSQVELAAVNRAGQARTAALADRLAERVVGHRHAIDAVSAALRRAEAGLADPRRPYGSFLLCGPTGTGKTHLARALALELFGSENALIRLDMSEFMDRSTVTRLVGASPGYVGHGEPGQLTEPVRRRPYCVLLLDEIEKAHPDVCQLLLQVMEEGELTDSQGRTVSFRHVALILSSNLAAGELRRGRTGFNVAGQREHDQHQIAESAVRRHFSDEFFNRLDAVLVLDALDAAELEQVLDLALADIAERVARAPHALRLKVTGAVRARLLADGTDQAMGARPLRRALQRIVLDPVADTMLDGAPTPASTVTVDLAADGTPVARLRRPPRRRR